MGLKWYSVVIDCQDLHAQARWWADVLDWQLFYEADNEAVVIPKAVRDGALSAEEWPNVGPGLVFVPVGEGNQTVSKTDSGPDLDGWFGPRDHSAKHSSIGGIRWHIQTRP